MTSRLPGTTFPFLPFLSLLSLFSTLISSYSYLFSPFFSIILVGFYPTSKHHFSSTTSTVSVCLSVCRIHAKPNETHGDPARCAPLQPASAARPPRPPPVAARALRSALGALPRACAPREGSSVAFAPPVTHCVTPLHLTTIWYAASLQRISVGQKTA